MRPCSPREVSTAGDGNRLGHVDMMKMRRKAAKGGKKKCCRSRQRCKLCPVVLKRLEKTHAFDLDDAALEKVWAKARIR